MLGGKGLESAFQNAPQVVLGMKGFREAVLMVGVVAAAGFTRGPEPSLGCELPGASELLLLHLRFLRTLLSLHTAPGGVS